jgi:hypothetical protein
MAWATVAVATCMAALAAPTGAGALGTSLAGFTDAAALGTAPTLSAAPTTATIAPSLSTNRPSAKGALTLSIRYAGGELGVPEPVHRSVLSLPRGLAFEIPNLHSCSVARIRAAGPAGCPRQSLVGRGHALGEALVGAEVVTEEATLWVFVGPPSGNYPTLELVGEGSDPVPAQVIVTGTVLPAKPPYGEEIVIPVPPIPSLPGGSEASVANLTLTLGSAGVPPSPGANTVVVPSRCPAGGYPFAAAFTYADGTGGNSFGHVSCPASASRHRHRHRKAHRAADSRVAGSRGADRVQAR